MGVRNGPGSHADMSAEPARNTAAFFRQTRTGVVEDMGISKLKRDSSRAGFTLIELLVVITIILALVGMIGAGVGYAMRKAKTAEAKSDINTFKLALSEHESKKNNFPGVRVKPPEGMAELKEWNVFPDLFRALYYAKSDGGVLETAPLSNLKRKNICVLRPSSTGEKEYHEATVDEIEDFNEDKYYLDPWVNPYSYRENKGKREKQKWMIDKNGYDAWSWGEDEVNDAWRGPEYLADSDDIGNWN